jgi:8-oxo-dGTP pyrophosphatase MutT (NUDIX family)
MTKKTIKNISAVMVFVFDNKKNILLLKRIDNKRWEPVKGGINNGENWSHAAKRELHEETGFYPVGKIVLLKIINDDLTLKNNRIKINGHVTYCAISGEKPTPIISGEETGEAEHEDYKWVNIGSIKSLNIFPKIANTMVTKAIKAINLSL